MDPLIVVVLCLTLLVSLLVAETPVAFSLATSGAVGLILLRGVSHVTSELSSAPFSATASFSLSVIPMFILLGMFALYGRIADQLFAFASRTLGRVPGGLGSATVLACAGFGAVTGSSVASAATMGRLAIDRMIDYGYPKPLATGIVSAAGTLGTMIPPSIILVLYAVITGESTGEMLIAGVVPGVISAVSYVVYIMARSRSLGRKGVVLDRPVASSAPSPAESTATFAGTEDGEAGGLAGAELRTLGAVDTVDRAPVGAQASMRDAVRGALRGGFIFLVVIGGIYTGIFTPTESGALGALAALVMMLLELRNEPRKTLIGALRGSFRDTASTTSMIFAILVGAAIFSRMLVFSGVPQDLSTAITGLDVSPLLIVGIMLLVLIPLGMFLESISILVIVMPLVYPVVTTLGFSGVWFGILAVKLIELGMITPPVGVITYVAAASSDRVSVEDAFRGVLPFAGVDLVVTAILFAIPGIVLWLPSQVG